MYPNSPEQQPPQQPLQPQTSLDYLDAISTRPQTKTISPKLLWALIGGGILLVVIAFLALSSLFKGSSPTEDFLAYEYRVNQLSKITEDESKTIKSSDLRALNGSLHTILVGAESQANTLLPTLGIKKYTPPKAGSPLISEFSTLSSKLDDARLNNNFDQVYSREMGYQLAKVVAELEVISKASRSSSVKDYAASVTANLKPYIDQFNEFNAQT